MARTDFEPLTWEEAEQNRCESLERRFAPLLGTGIPGSPARLQTAPSSPRAVAYTPIARTGNESRVEACDRLRTEIKRGREYLQQAEKDLAESRSLLEDWPAYEQICGKNPLAHLTQSVLFNEQIAQFLTAWLKRRELELDALAHPGRAAATLPPVRRAKPARNAPARKSPPPRSPRLKPPVRAVRGR